MEAIFELAAAIVIGFVEAAAMLLQVVVELLFHAIVFLLTALFSGLSVAKENRHRRLEALREPTSSSVAVPADSRTAQNRSFWPKSRREWGLFGVGVIVIVLVIAGLRIQQITRQRRIDATKGQVEKLADLFIQQAGQPNPQLRDGVLPDLDAWNHPCELFVDEWWNGTQVVIRSAGPDGKTGTIDDMLAIRFHKAPIKAVGKHVLNIGIDAAKEKLKKLVPQKQNALPPK